MIPAWKQYQEDAAAFFRSIGLTADTDVTVQGIRTKHDIDVFVTIDVAGFEVRWIVECKHWRTAVNKLHVMALREIVSDLGVDRGVILCEEGFQSGALEAANLTNVQLASLADLSVSAKTSVYAARLRDLFDRVESCKVRFWDLPKDVRQEHGLRIGWNDATPYSGMGVIEFCEDLVARAFRGAYPIEIISNATLLMKPVLPERFLNQGEVVSCLEGLLAELDRRLMRAEAAHS